MKLYIVALLCLGAAFATKKSELAITLVSPSGLHFSYPAQDDVTIVSVHFEINQKLEINDEGSNQVQLTQKSPGLPWTFEDQDFQAKVGDVISYWFVVKRNGRTSLKAGEVKLQEATVQRKKQNKATITDPSTCSAYPCLIFEDTFDSFDLDAWEHEISASGGGNWEFQYYTNNRSNSYVKNGVLYIKPTLTTDKYGNGYLESGTLDIWGTAPPNLCTGNAYYGCFRAGNPTNILNPIQSARIRTVQSFNFRHGRVEVSAQMPRGDWLWPAIWMLPKREFYGMWPSSGEIDLVESRGNLNLRNEQGQSRGHDHVGITLHWGPFYPHNGFSRTQAERTGGTYGTAFHTYGMEWDDTKMDFFLDGQLVLHVDPGANGFWEFGGFAQSLPGAQNPWVHGDNKMAPFDKDFYFIINLAVGGTNGYFQDGWTNSPAPKPWSNTSPQAFKDFWDRRGDWLPTWNQGANNGEDAALKVNYVRAWKLANN